MAAQQYSESERQGLPWSENAGKGFYYDAELITADLPLAAKVLLEHIRACCNKTAAWYETDATAAEATGLGFRTVQDNKKILVSKGWLAGTKRDGTSLQVRMTEKWYADKGKAYAYNINSPSL